QRLPHGLPRGVKFDRRDFPIRLGALPCLAARIKTKPDRSRSTQDFGCARRERKAAMAGEIGQDEALRHQLANDRKPPAAIELVTDAKCLKPIMPQADDPLGLVAEQDIDQVMRAETLTRSVDRRQRFLGCDGSVPARDRRTAIVAIPARRVIDFAEIAEQGLPPARNRFAVADQRLDFLPFDAALLGCRLTAFEQPQQIHYIGDPVRHPCISREPIASRAARLLVVSLEIFWRVEMGDKAYIRLVDPHTKGNGCNNYDAVVSQKTLLVTLTRRSVETSIIGMIVAEKTPKLF